MNEPGRERLIAGAMTGTSLDGLDVAIARVRGSGLAMRVTLAAHGSHPLGDLGPELRRLAQGETMSAGEITRVAHELGSRHASAIADLVPATSTLAAAAIHGQTVFHEPPHSWQLINVAPIVQRLECPVVFDLRQADLAAGGQGAPITPLADWIIFRDTHRARAVVNLGGFCNVTIIPRARTEGGKPTDHDTLHELSRIAGFDACACNHVLDGIARRGLGQPFDTGGRVAACGRVVARSRETLTARLNEQSRAGRSLGTGDELSAWIDEALAGNDVADVAATAVDALARHVVASLADYELGEVILAGGGAHNTALCRAIEGHAAVPVLSTADLGVPITSREALAIAVLGALCADGVAITLPQVTGCAEPAPVAGTWAGLDRAVRPTRRASSGDDDAPSVPATTRNR